MTCPAPPRFGWQLRRVGGRNAGGGVAAGGFQQRGAAGSAGFAFGGSAALRAGGFAGGGVGFISGAGSLPALRAGGGVAGGAVAGRSLSASACFFSAGAGLSLRGTYKTPRPAPLRLFSVGGAGSAFSGGGRLSVLRRGRRAVGGFAGGWQR